MLNHFKNKLYLAIETLLDFALDIIATPRVIALAKMMNFSWSRRVRYHYIFNQKIQRAQLFHRMQKLGITRPITAKVWWSRGLENFGDELTPYLLANLAGIDCKFSRGKELIAVGSIVRFATKETYVWGSGIIKNAEKLNGKPHILALRGPRSKALLEQNGIACPNVFGDPAMLLPVIFEPKPVRKKRRLLVPHFKQAAAFPDFANIETISLSTQSVEDIETILEAICNAESVVTSSLHVFIVCVAYHVPVSVFSWTSIPIGGDGVKFYDFCEGVGAAPQEIFEIDTPDEETIHRLFSMARVVQHNFDCRALLTALKIRFSTTRLEEVLSEEARH